MARIKTYCPQCNKVWFTVKENRITPTILMRKGECGHVMTVKASAVSTEEDDTLNITSLTGKKPFKYQLDGGRFIETANGRCLVADEMGLGKTVQAGMYIIAHPEVRPVVAFVKSGLRVQWMKMMVEWGDLMCQIIDGTKGVFLLPGMDVYIISIDSAWRIDNLVDLLKAKNVKTAIIDECQMIKNGTAKRTRAIRDVCSMMEHVIGLSGTPIKNNAAEYFPILNILRPDKFGSERNFIYGWCDTYYDGYKSKTGGIKDPRKFQDYTKDFIIRRERKEVLPDLPLIFRQFTYHELGEMVEKAYLDTVREFQEFYSSSSGSFADYSNILAYLSKMRHLTGLAKIEPVCEYVEEFITTTDRKIMLFVHHQDVGQAIKMKLESMSREWPAEWGKGILEITSDMDAYERDDAVTRFASSDYRVMIGSTLASGEGLNLQFCSDMIMVERQWNPANEEQAEARFPRPGSTADKINAMYFIATGTVDEFFSKLVEQKREIVATTLGGEAMKWDETSLVKDLARIISEKGGQAWGW